MQRAIEQAGSVFTGWISSCLFCLDSNGDDESAHHQRAMEQKGTEREMQICHTQPHLVPPMKLVVYDDLPSPGPPPRASSFPTWVMEESRSLASRASNRASMSFKRKSSHAVRISAPSDFRRVPTLPPTLPGEFHPLKLSFDNPLNPLPDLPRFKDFGLEEEQLQLPTRPPKALSCTTELTRTRTHRPSSSFNLPRKPVGSGSRRSSLATLELLMEKPVFISNPLIPHFSTRASTPSVATGLAASVLSSPPTWQDTAVGGGSQLKNAISHEVSDTAPSVAPKTPTTTLQDRSLPSIPIRESPSSGNTSYQPPTTPLYTRPQDTTPNASPPRSNRVAQWLLQTSNSPPSTWKTSLSEKMPFRIRSRTLSGSTLAPSITSMVGGFRSTPPMSSGAATVRTSTLDSRIEKDLDFPISRPYVPRQTMSEERPYPTIFEGQQHQHSGQYQNKEQYGGIGHSYYNDHRRSAVGLAF